MKFQYVFTNNSLCYQELRPLLRRMIPSIKDAIKHRSHAYSNLVFDFTVHCLESLQKETCSPRDIFILIAYVLAWGKSKQNLFDIRNVSEQRLRPWEWKREQMDWTNKERNKYKKEHNGQLWPPRTFQVLDVITDADTFMRTTNKAHQKRLLSDYPMINGVHNTPINALLDGYINFARVMSR